MDEDLKKQTALGLRSHWELEFEVDEFDRSAVLQHLSNRILAWLESDFERLVNAMYRLDVPEAHFHEAMSLQDPKKIAPQIAELVWERELKRAWYRKKYS